MKNKLVKDNSVEESRPLEQAVSLGWLSSHSRVTTDRQSATWSARALGRGARSKNQRHSAIRLGSWNVGSNMWFKKTDKRKITFKSGNNESEIDFILVSKEYRKFLKDVKVIPWELQHRLLVVGVDNRKLNKVV